jgi:hypothetical protein
MKNLHSVLKLVVQEIKMYLCTGIGDVLLVLVNTENKDILCFYTSNQ